MPVRYLLGSFMCLQMLLGPTFAYSGLDEYQTNPIYQMKVPEDVYFGYIIPAVALFILGLHITAGKLKGEVLNLNQITEFVDQSGKLPYTFIIVGFLSSYVQAFFSSELGFVFYLLSGFKFIGAFMLILGTKKLKLWVLIVVFGSIIISTLRQAMFHDLLTWSLMLGAVICLKYKPGLAIKTAASFGFIMFVVVIQLVKGDYRKAAWQGDESGTGAASFQAIVEKRSEDNSLFSTKQLAENNLRINQGFIITHILSWVPKSEPFADGQELFQILEAAFLPRIVAPDKLRAGDKTIFTKYSGMHLQQNTSMGLSSPGDAYINFGVAGGCIFMFVLGLIFSEVLNGFYRFSKVYPFLLMFTPLVYYYPIRPDCELQTTLGHLVKSCMLIYFMIIFWRQDLSKISKKRLPVTTSPV